MNLKKHALKIIAAIFFVFALIGGVTYYSLKPRSEIIPFVHDRDAKEMLKIFYDDWYWLFPGDDYSPEYILKHQAPGKEWYQQKYKGKLSIRVVRKEGTIAGFTTFYKKNLYEGVVQFISVAPGFRRKGLATKLTVYAVDQLFKMGVMKVTLTTRMNNPARKIYEGMGFTETGRDGDEFIFYKIDEKTFRQNISKKIKPKQIEGL